MAKDYSKKISVGQEECEKIWDWLRNFLPYLKDYEKFKKTQDYKKFDAANLNPIYLKEPFRDSGNLKSKWGFYPLRDPKNNFYSDMFDQILDLISGDSPDFIVIQHSCEIGSSFPFGRKTLMLEIDIDKPLDSINESVKYEVQKKQKELGIQKKPSQFGNLFFTYRSFVLLKMGWSLTRIRQDLKENKNARDTDPQAHAERKRINRAIEKAQRVISRLNSADAS